MTGAEIKALADAIADDVIDETDALLWLKEVLTNLGSDARNIANADFEITDITADNALPADFLAAIKAVRSTIDHWNYTVFNNTIRFHVTGTSTLYYYRKPTLPTSLDTEIDTHPQLHPALALFLASRFKRKDDDENPDARSLFADFISAKADAIYEIDNPERGIPKTVKLVRLW